MTGKRGTLQERFERYYIPEPNSGCWLWVGSLRDTGYGQLSVGVGKPPIKAHILSYRLFKGEIPVGLDVRHTCDIRCCVNPDHLLIGTRKENVADARSRDRLGKITDAQAKEIIKDPRKHAEIARDYGVTFSWVSKLKKGKRKLL